MTGDEMVGILNYVKTCAKFILPIVYKFLCVLLPNRKNRIVLYSYPDAADSSWHIFLYLINNSREKEFIWLCEAPELVSRRIFEAVKGTSHTVRVGKKNSFLFFLHFCMSYIAFTTTRFYPFVAQGYGPIVVSLWHGMPIKTVGVFKKSSLDIDNEPLPVDFTISTSELFSKILAIAFTAENGSVLPLGLPRNDALLESNINIRHDIEEKISITMNSKLVFWLPTYRKSLEKYGLNDSDKNSFMDEWSYDFFIKLNEVARIKEIVIIIKIHPADCFNLNCSIVPMSNIKLIKSADWERLGINLYDALAVSDALVSDVSSVLVDYMIVGKPVGIIKTGLADYRRGVTPGVEEILDEFHSIYDESSFFNFIEKLDGLKSPSKAACEKYNVQALTRQSACKAIAHYFDI